MAGPLIYDRVLETSTTTGTGTYTLAGAVTGYQTFAAVGNANTCPYAAWEVDADGNPSGGWEVGIGTYTTSGTTLARTSVLASSNSGSAVDWAAGTRRIALSLPAKIIQGWFYKQQTYIAGLIVTKNTGGNTLDISAGSCYDPSSGKIITYAGGSGVNAGTLGASQWNQVYIYDNAGTATIEVVNNAAPPSTAYAGTARQGGTNSNRRWIGSFLTTSGSAIIAQDVKEVADGVFETVWLANTLAAPFAALSAGSSTTLAAVSLVGGIPRYVASEAFLLCYATFATTGGDDVVLTLSIDNSNSFSVLRGYVEAANVGFPLNSLWTPIEPGTPQVYYKVAVGNDGSGPRGYIAIQGYRAAR